MLFLLCISCISDLCLKGGILLPDKTAAGIPGQCMRKRYCLALAFCWCCGMLWGIGFCCEAASVLLPWIRRTVLVEPEYGPLLCVRLLPFLCSVCAVVFSVPPILYGVCFVRGFLMGFVSFGILYGFGDAGWMICGLLQLGSCLSIPALYLYWLRCLSGKGKCLFGGAVCFLVLLGIAYVDYCVISPFLACLINFQKG